MGLLIREPDGDDRQMAASLTTLTWAAPHCPKFTKLSRDILRSVDATKCNGAELLGLFSRNMSRTALCFLNEPQNILRTSL